MKDHLDYRNYQSLILKGQRYEGADQLAQLCQELVGEGAEWAPSLAQFVGEWLADTAHIDIQTSGSTGVPKRIKVKKRAMVASALKTIAFFNLQPKDRALLCLSTQYIAGKMMVVRALVGGLNLIPVPVVADPLSECRDEMDFAAMVPSQVHAIMEKDLAALNRIQKLIVGGGAFPPSLKVALSPIHTEIWETYGMTETVSHIALRKVQAGTEEKPFQCLPGVQISQDNRTCLVISAPEICDEALVTNDLVQLLGSDQFMLLGRWDNVINTGGVKVFPEQIEARLAVYLDDPFVIVGIPDAYWGQKVVLVIEQVGAIDLTDVHFSGVLGKFEQPKEVFVLSSFPRTATGKVQRQQIVQMLVDKQKA